jgi:mRNA interferase MazF
MATKPTRGDVWLVDLGMVAKVRPCLVLSVPADDENDRVLTNLVPHTTSTQSSRFEIRSDVRFLKPGAFDAQKIHYDTDCQTYSITWHFASGTDDASEGRG